MFACVFAAAFGTGLAIIVLIFIAAILGFFDKD